MREQIVPSDAFGRAVPEVDPVAAPVRQRGRAASAALGVVPIEEEGEGGDDDGADSDEDVDFVLEESFELLGSPHKCHEE